MVLKGLRPDHNLDRHTPPTAPCTLVGAQRSAGANRAVNRRSFFVSGDDVPLFGDGPSVYFRNVLVSGHTEHFEYPGLFSRPVDGCVP